MVLVVSLTIAAIGVYELCGFGLRPLDRRPHLFDDGFATAGVIAATVAAGAAVGNLVWLLTASHRRAAHANGGAAHADEHDGAPTAPEVSKVPASSEAPEASQTTDIPEATDTPQTTDTPGAADAPGTADGTAPRPARSPGE
jgi:hypothetical protein